MKAVVVLAMLLGGAIASPNLRNLDPLDYVNGTTAGPDIVETETIAECVAECVAEYVVDGGAPTAIIDLCREDCEKGDIIIPPCAYVDQISEEIKKEIIGGKPENVGPCIKKDGPIKPPREILPPKKEVIIG